MHFVFLFQLSGVSSSSVETRLGPTAGAGAHLDEGAAAAGKGEEDHGVSVRACEKDRDGAETSGGGGGFATVKSEFA